MTLARVEVINAYENKNYKFFLSNALKKHLPKNTDSPTDWIDRIVQIEPYFLIYKHACNGKYDTYHEFLVCMYGYYINHREDFDGYLDIVDLKAKKLPENELIEKAAVKYLDYIWKEQTEMRLLDLNDDVKIKPEYKMECCDNIENGDEVKHVHSIIHMATYLGIDKRLLRKRIRDTVKSKIKGRTDWTYDLICPECYSVIPNNQAYTNLVPSASRDGLIEFEAKILDAFVYGEVLRANKYFNRCLCRKCNKEYLIFCNNNVYQYDKETKTYDREMDYETKEVQIKSIGINCALCGGLLNELNGMKCFNKNGLEGITTEKINNSIVLECRHCKENHSAEGWITRYFDDATILRLSMMTNSWIGAGAFAKARDRRLYDINIGRDRNGRNPDFRLKPTAITYNTNMDCIDRIAFLISNKTDEPNKASKTSLVKAIEALVPMLSENDLDVLLNKIENNIDARGN